MIVDRIDNAHVYAGLGAPIVAALEYLKYTDLTALRPGRHEIDGPNVYAVVSEYWTRPVAQGRWEAHRRYIDLQCVVRGAERIGHAPADVLIAGPYDEGKDITWLTGEGSFVTLQAGDFMILFPHDAHMPGIAVDAPAAVKKIVVKISVEPS